MKFIDMLTYFQQWADCSVQIEWKKSPLHFHYHSAYDATSIHNDSLTNPEIMASYSYQSTRCSETEQHSHQTEVTRGQTLK